MEVNQRFAAFSKPFILAAKNVFSTMLSAQLKTLKPAIKRETHLNGDISAIIEVSGTLESTTPHQNFTGFILLSWPLATYLKMASTMLMTEYTEFSDEIKDVGIETASIIMTNIKKDLKALGYNFTPIPPSLVQGPTHTLSFPAQTPMVSVPIDCEHGSFFMEFYYYEKSVS